MLARVSNSLGAPDSRVGLDLQFLLDVFDSFRADAVKRRPSTVKTPLHQSRLNFQLLRLSIHGDGAPAGGHNSDGD